MTPPIHVDLAQHMIKMGRGRGLSHYVSKSLHEAEVRYLPLENAILAMVHATYKLPHYL